MENNKKTILIVEDEKDVSSVIAELITSQGFNAVEAEDGEVGLDKALSEHPDLILVDILMPRKDGMEMIKELRSHAWGKNIPIVLLTNLNQADKVAEAIEYDVTDYIVKSDITIDSLAKLISDKIG